MRFRVRKGRVIGYSLITLGVVFLTIGLVMPFYKSPQRLQGSGPNVDFSAKLPYFIRSYIIPPIDDGQPINLSVLSDHPGSTTVLLAAYDSNSQTITGPVLLNVAFAKDQKGVAIFTAAGKTSPYMLQITSYNSSFTFNLTSVWSPFYELRSLATLGLATTPFGLVIVYYDSIAERKEKMFEEALKGVPRPTA